jgi:hypothetical protein
MFPISSDAVSGAVPVQDLIDVAGKCLSISDILLGQLGIVFRKIKGIQLLPDRVEGDHGVEFGLVPFQYS